MNDAELNRCLEVGLAAALEAGPIALEYFRHPMAVSDKEGAGGLVTDLEGRTPLAGGTVVAAANPVLHAAALGIMAGSSP